VAIELRHVTAGYGRSPAITDVSLRVLRGTTVAVLGPNGSGKTTLARVMTGGLMPSAGQIVLDGTDATGRATARVARMGVFHVPDDRAIYPSLTVRENLRMALRFAVPRRQVGAEIDRVFELLPSLRLRATTRAGLLSGGEQQMLAIARAIAAPPAILVVDELSHGLAPLVVAEMFEILRRLKERVTLVVIEQFTERALAIADTVVVLRRGAVIHTGPVGGVTDDDLVAWYDLGGTEPFAATPADPSKNPSRTPATPSEARRP